MSELSWKKSRFRLNCAETDFKEYFCIDIENPGNRYRFPGLQCALFSSTEYLNIRLTHQQLQEHNPEPSG